MPLRERLGLQKYRSLYLEGPSDWMPDLAPTVCKAEQASSATGAHTSEESSKLVSKTSAIAIANSTAPFSASDCKGRAMDKPGATDLLVAPAPNYKGRAMDKPGASGLLRAPASDSEDTKPCKRTDSKNTEPRKGTVKGRVSAVKGRVSAVKNSAMRLLTSTLTNAWQGSDVVQTSQNARSSSRRGRGRAQTAPAAFSPLMPSESTPAWEDKADRGSRRRSTGGFVWTRAA
eukprot:CAMPEP_0197881090 /NCGR_PEP_ID=MMETSP1439-20131203/8688_1 /TAXON_ID=66791 /ORGANISM="Gonyaulax spinifera, Strain CCMP409" /LENGTH=230 /DNA_ID=CAMNT_0043500673 /DNA_START=1 /DNA_END=693 /DNA_ORIENTATION=-